MSCGHESFSHIGDIPTVSGETLRVEACDGCSSTRVIKPDGSVHVDWLTPQLKTGFKGQFYSRKKT